MAAPATKTEILDVNRRYHDVAAGEYDAKWGISFARERPGAGRRQARQAARRRGPGPFARSLEIGAGTGYFSLNMLQAGVVGEATCTDISPGMLATLEANAARLGLDVETAACDAAALPFEDESFDLVFGHAVLHHLPELDRAFAEFHRVLRPGGTLFFAGEPSRQGDRIAAVPKRVAWRISPAWRARAAACRRRRTSTAHRAGRRRRPRPRVPGRRARVRARRPRAPRRRRRLRARARARRGAAGELVRLVQPHAGGQRRPEGDPDAVDPLRAPRLPAAAGRRPAAARGPPAAAALLQPDARGHQARERRRRARRRARGRSSRRARWRCSATAARSWTPASAPSRSSRSTRSRGWRPPPPSRSGSSS